MEMDFSASLKLLDEVIANAKCGNFEMNLDRFSRFPHAFPSSMPPHTRRVLCPTQYPWQPPIPTTHNNLPYQPPPNAPCAVPYSVPMATTPSNHP